MLEFKVIEFNKDSKRIVVSHARTHEEEKRAHEKAEKVAKAEGGSTTEKSLFGIRLIAHKDFSYRRNDNSGSFFFYVKLHLIFEKALL
ncbi:MAG TPA: hypothetical protein VN698_07600 [Bacteroidia bacterium]|nr:hypothetical protein [Bacteroidia bacterium]